jgi:hypothetical protein
MASQSRIPPVTHPTVDVGEQLARFIGDTGTVHDVLGGYRIHVHHTRGFPWDDVFKLLLYREFQVSLGHTKADIFIEARP